MKNQEDLVDIDNMLNEIEDDHIQIPKELSMNTHRLLLQESSEIEINPYLLGVVIAISFLLMVSGIGAIVFSALFGKAVFLQIVICSIASNAVASIVIFIFKDELFKRLTY